MSKHTKQEVRDVIKKRLGNKYENPYVFMERGDEKLKVKYDIALDSILSRTESLVDIACGIEYLDFSFKKKDFNPEKGEGGYEHVTLTSLNKGTDISR